MSAPESAEKFVNRILDKCLGPTVPIFLQRTIGEQIEELITARDQQIAAAASERAIELVSDKWITMLREVGIFDERVGRINMLVRVLPLTERTDSGGK